jgi:predicted RNA-binding Zn ribbon-like protein
MLLASNMARQAGLAAMLVNIALPGHAGGRPYEGLDDVELARSFLALLLPRARRGVAAVPDCGRRLRSIAEALRPAFEASGMRETAKHLNALMRRFRAQPYLTEDVGQPFHLHFHGDAETAIESLGGEFATALALLIDNYGCKRFGPCEAQACDRVYVDLTRNGSRRFCSDPCAARAKMAAYRARKGAG